MYYAIRTLVGIGLVIVATALVQLSWSAKASETPTRVSLVDLAGIAKVPNQHVILSEFRVLDNLLDLQTERSGCLHVRALVPNASVGGTRVPVLVASRASESLSDALEIHGMLLCHVDEPSVPIRVASFLGTVDPSG